MNRKVEMMVAFGVSAGAAAMLLVTGLSQHPNRAFDRFRSLDRIGFAIPNWRFFAPEPAMNDYHVLHRTLDAGEVQSPWQETHHVTPRSLGQLFWFPDRRRDKALFDAASDVVGLLSSTDETILASTSFRVLSAFVRRKVELTAAEPPLGYQFLLARSAGRDTSLPPEEILTSPFIPLSGHP